MCELFGISSAKKMWLNNYLKVFFSHSNEHPNGWGIVCFDGSEAVIEKEPVEASVSKYLRERLTQPVNEKCAFAHIRKATIGNESYKNCHPFTLKDNSGRRWTFIHNGTIFDYKPLERYSRLQSGDTDSERILLYIIDMINEAQYDLGHELDFDERFELLSEIVTDMSYGNKLNLLLYDGEYVYAHTNYEGSLYSLKKEEGIMISTQPLSDERWKPVPFTRLLAYQDGKLVKEGKPHDGEYIVKEEDIKYLYQIFANL